jgi:type II secretory pathway component PulJ
MSTIISLLTALSIGALISSSFQFWIDKAKSQRQKRDDFKETRYKAIVILMHSLLEFDLAKPMLEQHRKDLKNVEDLKYELLSEWRNMLLFASDGVLRAMKIFLKSPTEENFWRTGLEMRKDLYGLKTKIEVKDLL